MGKLEIDPNLKNKLENIFGGKKVIVPEKKRTSLPVFAREKPQPQTTPARVSQPVPQPPPHTVASQPVAPPRVSQQPTFSLQINISGDVKDAIVFASVSMLIFRIGYVILFL